MSWWTGYRAKWDGIRDEIVSILPGGSERIQPTTNVDGIETDGSGPDQNLVLAWFWGGGFLENDVFSLEIRLEAISVPSECCEPPERGSWM